MKDDKTGDGLPPLTAEDREIIGLAREHAPVVYTNRHFPDSPSFSFPTSKLLTFARAYAAAAVARERAKWEAAQTQTKGLGYGVNPRSDDAAAIRKGD